jgi:hypothetical protein
MGTQPEYARIPLADGTLVATPGPAGKHHPGCEADEQQGRVHLKAEGGQPGPGGERVRGSEQRHAA